MYFFFIRTYNVVSIYKFAVKYVCVLNKNKLFEIYWNMKVLFILNGIVNFYEEVSRVPEQISSMFKLLCPQCM